ncbi:unnamed protein product [Oikopleura dioica]|uniref:Potassium channel domain-containing protein n=1 Tax=Oikopleura dioica TaxID=34765 RepID=E4YI87_OIKDI|nr:unnamed protein product [Oikopleura dioica]
MERTAQFGINNYLALKKDCTDHWNFHNAFFFAGTVATTIGYGNISPSTNHGKLFCITFTVIGIPYFAYMVGALAELISYKIDDIVKKFQSKSMTKISPGAISSLYVILGCILLIVIPSYVFTLVEDWSMLDAIYYSVISLTTIGFGDLIPRNEPPMSKAIHVKNESIELINPVPSQDDKINNDTGLSEKCDPNEWPENIKIVFNLYRVMVFFWILAGLTWLGGVVSMLTDLLNLSVSYQFDVSFASIFRRNRVIFPPIWNLIGSDGESEYVTKNANNLNTTLDEKALFSNMNNSKMSYMNKLNYSQLGMYPNRIRLDRSQNEDANYYRRIHNSTELDESDLDDFERRNRKNLTVSALAKRPQLLRFSSLDDAG